jgi:tRNA G18 (ribose-2'-O)-methylase SpoU
MSSFSGYNQRDDRGVRRRQHEARPTRRDGVGNNNFAGRRHESVRSQPPRGLGRDAHGELLFGTHPVLAALVAAERRAYVLYVQDSAYMSGAKDKLGRRILQLARNLDARQHRSHPAADDDDAYDDNGDAIDADVDDDELPFRIVSASRHDLNLMSDNKPHNGFVLDCEELKKPFVDRIDEKGPCINPLSARDPAVNDAPFLGAHSNVWLALDGVTDPQNLGAIIRSCRFFDIAGVILCQRNSAPLSPATSKASSGAMELTPVLYVKSMPKFLRNCRKLSPSFGDDGDEDDAADVDTDDDAAAVTEGGGARKHGVEWAVVGLSATAHAGVTPVTCGELGAALRARTAALAGDDGNGGSAAASTGTDVAALGPTILVAGSEGQGLKMPVLQLCNFTVSIQPVNGDGDDDAVVATGDGSLLDSLNVSTAVAVTLNSLVGR